MKIPIPGLSGIENVLDFNAARARASPELQDALAKTKAGLDAGMSPSEIRSYEVSREQRIIAGAMVRLRNYSSTTDMVAFVEGMLVQLTGEKA